MLWLPYTAYTLLVRSSAASSSPLADTGEVLLLMLACHAPAGGLLPPNPFCAALQRLQVRHLFVAVPRGFERAVLAGLKPGCDPYAVDARKEKHLHGAWGWRLL